MIAIERYSKFLKQAKDKVPKKRVRIITPTTTTTASNNDDDDDEDDDFYESMQALFRYSNSFENWDADDYDSFDEEMPQQPILIEIPNPNPRPARSFEIANISPTGRCQPAADFPSSYSVILREGPKRDFIFNRGLNCIAALVTKERFQSFPFPINLKQYDKIHLHVADDHNNWYKASQLSFVRADFIVHQHIK